MGRSRWSRDRTIVLLGWLALFGFHSWSSWRIGGPSVVFDEAGYLGNARWLAGGATWEMPDAPAYAAGYSLLLAPIMAIFGTADAQWRAVLLLNAALLASVFPLISLVARRVLGAERRVALAAGVAAALTPAVVAAGVSAIAENLVLPLVALSVLAAWAMVSSPGRTTNGWPYGYGLCVAVLSATHPRFTAVVVVGFGALIAGERRGIVSRRVALVNGGLLLAVGAAGRLLNQAVVSARWDRVERLQGSPRQWIDLLGSPSGWGELSLTAVGQLWYIAACSLGLGVIGVLAAVRQVRGQPRDSEPDLDRSGSAETGTQAVLAARRFALAVTLASAAVVFATSVVFFAQNQFRADHWVYGRHNDSFVPVWIALAVVALAQLLRGDLTARRTLLRDLGAAAGVVAASGVALIVWRDPTDLGSEFSPFAVPALIRMVGDHPSGTFWKGTALGLVGCGTVAAWAALVSRVDGHRRSAPDRVGPAGPAGLAALAGLALLTGWFVFAGFGVVSGTNTFETINNRNWHVPQDLRRLEVKQLSIEGETAKSLPMLSYPFALPDVDVTTYEADRGEQPQSAFSIARLDDNDRARRGDRVALLDEGGFYAFWDSQLGLALWVAPGPDQDRLAQAGLLLPEDFPVPLPESAQRVELDIADGPLGTVRVKSGGQVEATVTGRHLGRGSPWPDRASFALPGRVRVTAQVLPEDPANPEGARSGGELTAWVRPGDRFESSVQIIAIDTVLQPLPPGRYRVQLGVSQDGYDWFASGGPGGAFVLEVTQG